MKKRIISLLIAAVMCFGAFPAGAFAQGGNDQQEILAGVTISGGLWEEYANADIAFAQTGDEIDFSKRTMVRIGAVYDTGSEPHAFYFKDTGAELHSCITLWSGQDLDESKIMLSGVSAGAFTETVYGDTEDQGGRQAFVYRASVTVPKDDTEVVIYYDGNAAGSFKAVHIETEEPYISEMYVTDVKEDGTLVLELSGINIPENAVFAIGENQWDSEGYMTDQIIEGYKGSAVSTDSYGIITAELAPTENKPEQASWLQLTINGKFAYYYSGGNPVEAQLASITPLKGNSSQTEPGPDPVAITAPTVTMDASTVSSSVGVAIAPGSFTNMRYSVNGSQAQDWAPITESVTVTLPEQFGQYTITFEFNDGEGGHTTTVNKTVKYLNNVPAEAPAVSVVLSDGTEAEKSIDGVYILARGMSYSAKAAADAGLSIEFLSYDYGDSLIETADALYDAESGLYVLPLIAEGIGAVSARVKQGEWDIQAGAEARAELAWQSPPSVTNAYTPDIHKVFKTRADGSTYYGIYPNSVLACYCFGNYAENVQAYARLKYLSSDGTEKTVESGSFQLFSTYTRMHRGTITVPEDATQLLSVEYYMVGLYGSTGESFTVDMSSYYVLASVEITGFPESYNGAYLNIKDKTGGESSYAVISGGSAIMGNIGAGTYSYSVDGASGNICSGEITISGAGDISVPIGELPQLCTLTAELELRENDPNYALITVSWDEGGKTVTTYGYEKKSVFEQLPVGRTVTVSAECKNDPAFPGDVILGLEESPVITLAGDASATLKLVYAQTVKISGKILNTYGRPVAYAVVSSSQKVLRPAGLGGDWNGFSTLYSDQDGAFTIEIIKGLPADISIRSAGYYEHAGSITASADSTYNVTLALKDTGMVVPKLMVYPAVDISGNQIIPGAPASEASSGELYLHHIYRGGTEVAFYEVFADDTVRYYLDETGLSSGDVLDFRFYTTDSSYIYDGEADGYITVKAALDPKLCAQAEVRAKRLPSVRSTVVSEDSSETGYMVVYSGWDSEKPMLEGVASGRGTISCEGLEPDRKYTVVTMIVSPENLPSLANIALYNPARFKEKLSTDEGKTEAVVTEITPGAGVDHEITERPASKVLSLLFNGVSVWYNTSQIADKPGWMDVEIHLTGSKEGVTTVFKSIRISSPTQTANHYLNGTSIVGELGASMRAEGNMLYTFQVQADNSNMIAPVLTVDFDKYENGVRTDSDYISVAIRDKADIFALGITQRVSTEELEVFGGFLPITVRANVSEVPSENEISFFDNGVEVGKIVIDQVRTKAFIPIAGSDTTGLHHISATRTEGGETVSTENYLLNVVGGSGDIYISDISWTHINDHGPQHWHWDSFSDMGGSTLRYYPMMPSMMVFKINNFSEEEAEKVTFIVKQGSLYDDPVMEVPMLCIGSDDNGSSSIWMTFSPEKLEAAKKYYPENFDANGKIIDPFFDAMRDTHYNIGGRVPYSLLTWTHFGYLGGFDVDIEYKKPELLDIASDDLVYKTDMTNLMTYYDMMGGEIADYSGTADILDSITAEDMADYRMDVLAGMPASLRAAYSSADNFDVEVTDTDAIVTLKSGAVPGITSLKSGTELDTSGYNADALRDQMEAERENPVTDDGYTIAWATYESLQGTVFERYIKKETVNNDGTVTIDFRSDTYLPSSVIDAITGSTDTAASEPALKTAGLGTRLVASAQDGLAVLLAAEKPPAFELDTDRISTFGNIQGAADIFQDIKVAEAGKKAASLGKNVKAAEKSATFMSKGFGQACAVIGAAGTAYQIAQGPGGKDPNKLWTALKQVKNKDKAAELAQEILSYEYLRADKYMMDSFVGGTTTIAGVSDPNVPVKVGLLLGNLTYGKISDNTGEYMGQEWDAIMNSIINELTIQDWRDELKLEREAVEDSIRERLRNEGIKEKWRIEKILREEFDIVREDGRWRYKIKVKSPKIDIYIDPSGYVFEATETSRLDGVTATVLRGSGSTAEDPGVFTVWTDTNPDEKERQANPVTTNNEAGDLKGRYGWDVPYGVWKVRFEKDGYKTAESKAMTVPPIHTQVNIGLLSEAVPTVKSISKGAVTISAEFSMYMQMESLADPSQKVSGDPDANTDSYKLDYSAVKVVDPDGMPVPGTVAFTGKVKNTGYKDGTYQQDVIDSNYFVTGLVFTADEALDPSKTYTMMIAETALSYAGVPMGEIFAAEAVTTYTVSFDTAEGSAVDPQTVAYGKNAVKPADPARSGYTFTGWFADSACAAAFDFSAPITADTVIYAGWKEIPDPAVYTVSFDTSEGSAVAAQTVTEGSAPAKPEDPVRSGYVFGGWYADAACTEAFDFSKAASGSVTVYAKWILIDYNAVDESGAVISRGGVWTQGSEEGLELIFKRTSDDSLSFEKFIGIKIDGKDIDKKLYTAVKGSVKITLSPELLGGLSVGTHTLTAVFTDGNADVSFTVKAAAPASPTTGERSSAHLWAAFTFAVVCAGVLIISRRRKQQ